jgi:hypothetical protein
MADKPKAKNQGTLNIEAANARFTHEDRVAAGKKGGPASGAARRRAKTIRETLKLFLATELDEGEAKERLVALGFDPTMLNQMGLATLQKAMTGDIEAARFVRDSVGEKPREGLDVGIEDKPIASMDMSKLSDDQLRILAGKAEQDT